MSNNSFSQNLESLTENVNIVIETLVGINDSLTSEADSVNVTVNNETYSLPTYKKFERDTNSTKQTVDSLINGTGVVNLEDGTNRLVTANPIPTTPSQIDITSIETPTSFFVKDNWFYEDFVFPLIKINLDLSNSSAITDTTERVQTNRLIIDITKLSSDQITNIQSDFSVPKTYTETIDYLTNQNIKYFEDINIINFPLLSNRKIGTFVIESIDIVDSENVYTLDTVEYQTYKLTNQSDLLKYKNSIYKVTYVDVVQNKIKIEIQSGIDTPVVGDSFEYFDTPFTEKNIDINIGFNELDIIFLKSIDPYSSIISNDWSDSIFVYTNNLLLSTDSTISLQTYYYENIKDIGKYLQGVGYEKIQTAFDHYSEEINVPDISNAKYEIIQINDHLFSNKNDYTTFNENLKSISTIKSQINSVNKSIADLKASQANSDELTKLSNELNNLTTQYNTLINNSYNIIKNNNLNNFSPKYRIRGFFPFVEPTNVNNVKNEVIQYEVAYRYKYNNGAIPSENQFENVGSNKYTFSNWNIISSQIRPKKFDTVNECFVWCSIDEMKITQATDADMWLLINSIDIPISSGESVEFKIRSVSEAGWPLNPIKSKWSSSITVDSNNMPQDTISDTVDKITEYINDTNIQQKLDSVGFTGHIDDSESSFKHNAKNLKIIDDLSAVLNIQDFADKNVNKLTMTLLDSDSQSVTVNNISLVKLLQSIVTKIGLKESELYN